MPWVAERGIVALPDNVSFEEATFIEPINTIVKAVQKARVTAGETVLIVGCGPIGLQLLMVTKYDGARIYTSDPMGTRREKSMKLGALESFDPLSGKLVEELQSRTEGRGQMRFWSRWRTRPWLWTRWRRRGRGQSPAIRRKRPSDKDRVSCRGSRDRRKGNLGQLQCGRRHPRRVQQRWCWRRNCR